MKLFFMALSSLSAGGDLQAAAALLVGGTVRSESGEQQLASGRSIGRHMFDVSDDFHSRLTQSEDENTGVTEDSIRVSELLNQHDTAPKPWQDAAIERGTPEERNKKAVVPAKRVLHTVPPNSWQFEFQREGPPEADAVAAPVEVEMCKAKCDKLAVHDGWCIDCPHRMLECCGAQLCVKGTGSRWYGEPFDGCGLLVRQRELVVHVTEQCPNRIIQCSKACRYKFRVSQIEAHEAACVVPTVYTACKCQYKYWWDGACSLCEPRPRVFPDSCKPEPYLQMVTI